MWIKLRGGIGAYFCRLVLPNPLAHALATKFYKGLRKKANLKAPRVLRRTPQITNELLTRTCFANLTVSYGCGRYYFLA
jgi:hypothetical protein